MPELFVPTVVEKLQLFEQDIQNFADDLDLLPEDIDAAVCERVKEGLPILVPEVEKWRGEQLDVVTTLAHYALDEEAWYGREKRADFPFLFGGKFKDVFLEKVDLDLDSEGEESKYRMYLRFIPDIRAEEPDLVIADSVIVPPSKLEMIDHA